jgi:3'-phosphoadenosine 5'-phosphosulfate (PAPS) 3'-phosphatase
MHPALNIIIKAARRASQIINRAAHDIEHLQITTKRQSDFVTEVDKAAEAAIIEVLREAYPDYGILAEESGPPVARPAAATTSGSSTRSTERPTSSTAFPNTRSRSPWPTADRSPRRWSMTPCATRCSPPARAAAPSSTTAASASASA